MPLFGKIEDRAVKLSDIGQIARSIWCNIPDNYSRVALDEFIVMPNHIHGIIVILPEKISSVNPTSFKRPPEGSRMPSISLNAITPSLSVIIRQYKSRVKHRCTVNGFTYFRWQSRFYEHVIRNEADLGEIRDYIVNNAMKCER
jgi:REP element-mobilizing transposase RayT